MLKLRSPRGAKRQVRLQHSLELEQRLFVKHRVVEVAGRQAGFAQAILHGLSRETRIVFFSSEAFFLRRSRELPVDRQRGGAIVIKSRNTENYSQDGFRPDRAIAEVGRPPLMGAVRRREGDWAPCVAAP